MMVITFTVPQCVAKARPRFSGHAYTPRKTTEAEAAIRTAYEGACLREFGHVPRAPERVPVHVALTFVKAQPKSRPSWLPKAVWDAGRLPFVTKPDVDNLMKTTLDALNGVAWSDDSQVTEVNAIKLDRRGACEDRTRVTVIWEGEEDELR